VNGNGAERGNVETEVVEAGESFGGEEVAADFVVSGGGTFDESDAAASEGELDGGSGACGTTAENDGVEISGGCHRMRATVRRFIG